MFKFEFIMSDMHTTFTLHLFVQVCLAEWTIYPRGPPILGLMETFVVGNREFQVGNSTKHGTYIKVVYGTC